MRKQQLTYNEQINIHYDIGYKFPLVQDIPTRPVSNLQQQFGKLKQEA